MSQKIQTNFDETDTAHQIESASGSPDLAGIEARIAAGLCPKCGNAVTPIDQNCPFCRINLAWARQNFDQLLEKKIEAGGGPTSSSHDNSVLLCPACRNTKVIKHSSIQEIAVGIIATVLVLGLSYSGSIHLVTISAIALPFAFIGTIWAVFSFLFGKHKCKKCGHKWR